MVRLLPDSEKAPAGTVAPPVWRAWASVPAFRPAWASFLSSGTTETWRSRTPSTVTWPTPSMSWRAGTTVRSSWSARTCWSLSEVTARTTVGMSSVEAGDDLRVDAVGQLGAGPVHRLLDVGDELLGALVAEVEGRHDEGVALTGGGGDALDAVDGLEGVLQRLDDLLLDHIGRRTLVGRQHRDHRQFDGGQQLLFELRDRYRAEDQRDNRDQPDQGPLREAESGQPGHGWVSLLWRTRQRAGRGERQGPTPPAQSYDLRSAPPKRRPRAAFLCRAYRRWSRPQYAGTPAGQSARGRTRPDS